MLFWDISWFFYPQAVCWRCSIKIVFLEIAQNSQENTCACNFIKKETLAQVFSCEFCEVFMNTFSCRTPLITASFYPNQWRELQIPGYSSVRADHPSNTKRGGVLLYYKIFLSIKLVDVNYLDICIIMIAVLN